MDELTKGQRQYLRRFAHDLRPTVQIGKNGVTPQLIASVEHELDAHELVKVKFMDFRDEKGAIARDLSAQLDAALVAEIGNIAILYRQQRDPSRRKVILPRE